MSDFNRFVADSLHSILGFTETNAVHFVAALAKRSKSADELFSQLQQFDLPVNDQVRQFAADAFSRAPRPQSHSKPSAAALHEKQAAELLKKNESYRILMDEDEPVPSSSDKTKKEEKRVKEEKKSSSSCKYEEDRDDERKREKDRERERRKKEEKEDKKRDKHLRKRRDRDQEDESEDEAEHQRSRDREEHKYLEQSRYEEERVESSKRPKLDDVLAEFDAELESEEKKVADERLRDIQERDEFAERLKKRDEDSQKQTKKLTRSEREAEMRKAMSEEEKMSMVPDLRVAARVRYLGEREKKMAELLRRELEDEEKMFKGQKLSKEEMEELERKRELLRLAEESEKTREVESMPGYEMPRAYIADDARSADQNARFNLLKARYDKSGSKGDDKGTMAIQQEWESQQIAKATSHFGSKDKGEKNKQPEYELVFDDSINFVAEGEMAGDLTREDYGKADASASAGASSSSSSSSAKKTPAELIHESRINLPMYQFKDDLIKAIDMYQVMIVVSETGSGKTTQIPQYLHEAGYTKRGKIGCTQPRRVAAMSVAARVAEEMGVRLGKEVGYSIRFEDCTDPEKTMIKYMTDGMLLREFLSEPDLKQYSVMILDEAHERSLNTDILFGLLKDIARFRTDIKLIISSATLDAEKFASYFDGAPIFRVPGRRYPVDIFYTPTPEADYVEAAVMSALQIHVTQPLGDILIFFTGQEEIEAAAESLHERTKGLGTRIRELIVCQIYSSLPSNEQAKIFEPTPEGARKVILSTNIAETSLTINGVVYVIDSGFVKQNSYNPRTGMEQLMVVPISKAAARQRAGRAGRTCPGKCFRLYTAWSFKEEMDDNQTPEIQRTNLGNVVLFLKSLGIHDLINFDFLDPPAAETLIRALEELYALGALNDKGELTKMGRRMAEFPLDPMMSKALIASEKYGCSEEMMTICSMIQDSNAIFYKPKNQKVHAENAHKSFIRGMGDHITLLNVYNAWKETDFNVGWCFENFIQVRAMRQVRKVREQIERLMERVEVESTTTEDMTAVAKAVTAGFFFNAAHLQKSGDYRTVKNPQTVHMWPGSCLRESRPHWVVYFELVATKQEYMRQVVEIKGEWLLEIAPHYYRKDQIEGMGPKKSKGKGKANEES